MPTMKQQVSENTKNIQTIKEDINTIKNNHLFHLEKDVSTINKKIEKIDARLYYLGGVLIVTIVLTAIAERLM